MTILEGGERGRAGGAPQDVVLEAEHTRDGADRLLQRLARDWRRCVAVELDNGADIDGEGLGGGGVSSLLRPRALHTCSSPANGCDARWSGVRA